MAGQVTIQITFVLVLATICASTATKFSVDTEKNRIIDGQGRERIFHGTNVVFKTTPFIPITTHFDAR